MIHQMGLYGEYFHDIKAGIKTVEVRLYDEKRRKIKTSDYIEFIKVPERDERLTVKVVDLSAYPTFTEMYRDIPFSSFGCEGWTMEEMIDGTYDIYTEKQEKAWGVLAISIVYEGEE